MFGWLVVEDDIAKVVSRLFRIPTRGLPITIVACGLAQRGHQLGRLGARAACVRDRVLVLGVL
jgi:hypothetical protein